MGSKFCNLNLRGYVTADCLETLLPGLQVFPWENGWTTLTSPRLQWGQTQRYAAALSKETGCPVLSAEYFDDDYAELAVYREGKRMSRHVPATYEDLRRSRGNPDKFLSALEWDPTEAPRLKKSFRWKTRRRPSACWRVCWAAPSLASVRMLLLLGSPARRPSGSLPERRAR